MEDLPSSVQRQVEAVKEIEEALTGEQKPQENASNAPVNTVAPQEQNQPIDTRDDELRKAEQRYKSLQGMYNKDVAGLRAAKEEAEKARLEMQAEIEKLRKELSEKEVPDVSDEDKETFGEDMYDFVTRAARQEAKKLAPNDSLKTEIERLKADINARKAAEQEAQANSFLTSLDNALPDWREQDVDRDFIEWLSDQDPLYHVPRQEMLDRVVAARDVNAVVGIFNAYRQERQPNKVIKPKVGTNPLARQVAPAHTRNAPTNTEQKANRVFTQREIAEFYKEASLGRWSEDEFAALEKEIDRAVAEGRIA